MTIKVERSLFLPGTSGVARFWQPVIERLGLDHEHFAFDYPGFGGNPPDPKLASLEDLTRWIETYVDRPVDVFAQSMGGVIGLQLALRHPELVQHLILTGTSGGVPMGRFNVDDWRKGYRPESPSSPRWFADDRTDFSGRLANLPMPCLLIFGRNDRIAPVSVGEYLARLIPDARLAIIETDSHSFVQEMPDEVAGHIRSFLGL